MELRDEMMINVIRTSSMVPLWQPRHKVSTIRRTVRGSHPNNATTISIAKTLAALMFLMLVAIGGNCRVLRIESRSQLSSLRDDDVSADGGVELVVSGSFTALTYLSSTSSFFGMMLLDRW